MDYKVNIFKLIIISALSFIFIKCWDKNISAKKMQYKKIKILLKSLYGKQT